MGETRFFWCELVWPPTMGADRAIGAVRAVGLDPTSARLVLEVRSRAGHVRFLLGSDGRGALRRTASLLGAIPVPLTAPRSALTTGRRLRLSTGQRPLTAEHLDTSAVGILSALATTKGAEELAVQLLLGPRIPATPISADNQAPTSWWQLLTGASPARPDPQARAALTAKMGLPGFLTDVRLGATATTPARRQSLTLGLLGGLRLLEAPGVTMHLASLATSRIGAGDGVVWPWRLAWGFGLRLNAAEIAGLAGIPVTNPKAEESLPGLPPAHPRQLPLAWPLPTPTRDRIVVAATTAPGAIGMITRSNEALVRHVHVVGPTGVGKSVLLLNLALHDIAVGRGVVVLDPKGDLVTDLLARIPEQRVPDVVVLDPLAGHVVGLNPLTGTQNSAELRADQVLSVFTGLFGDALGPRTTDILHASLLTLARRPDASLVQIPQLLTDPRFRAPRIAGVMDDVALGPFWAWYQQLKDTERSQVIAPLMNKLRAVLLAPTVRRVLGQVNPKFSVRQVFSEHKILLVPLPVGRLGAQGARLLGSLVVAQVWDAARARTSLPVSRRTPVSVILDEAQSFLGYQTDIADMLATSRSYQVGWTIAHQHLGQLPPALREAVLTNARSRIVFQTSHADAATFAAQTGGSDRLAPEDFTSLPAFHAYMSLFDHGQVQPYVSARTLPAPPVIRNPDQLRETSTARWGRTPDGIEAAFTTDTSPARGTTPQPGRPTDGQPSTISGSPQHTPAGRTGPAAGLGRRPHRPSGRPTGRDPQATSEPAGPGQKQAVSPDATPAVSAAEPTRRQARGGQP